MFSVERKAVRLRRRYLTRREYHLSVKTSCRKRSRLNIVLATPAPQIMHLWRRHDNGLFAPVDDASKKDKVVYSKEYEKTIYVEQGSC